MKRFFIAVAVIVFVVSVVSLPAHARRFQREKRVSTPAKTVVQNTLTCQLKVEPKASECQFTLTVKNTGSKEAALKSATTQKYDIVVKNDKGEVLWQWSEGKTFSQMLEELKIVAKGEMAFSEKWNYKDKNKKAVKPGKYQAQGAVKTKPKEVKSEWVKFEVTEKQVSGKPQPIKGKVTKIGEKLYLLGDDGTAYLIPNPPPLLSALSGKKITVTTYKLVPIEGTEDKEIRIGAFID